MGTAVVVNSITLNQDGDGDVGYIYRQRYNATLVVANATRIKVIFSRLNNNYSISSAWIGHEGATGFTFDGNQVQLKFGGNDGATFTTTNTYSDEIDFVVDETKTLVISFRLSAGYNPYGFQGSTNTARSYVTSGDATTVGASSWAGSSTGVTSIISTVNGVLGIVPDTVSLDSTIVEPDHTFSVFVNLLSLNCSIVDPDFSCGLAMTTGAIIDCKLYDAQCEMHTGANMDCMIYDPLHTISTQHTTRTSLNLFLTDPKTESEMVCTNLSLIDCSIIDPSVSILFYKIFGNINCALNDPTTDIFINSGDSFSSILSFPARSFSAIETYSGNIDLPLAEMVLNSGEAATILSYSRRQ
jgi:hypothetical protein